MKRNIIKYISCSAFGLLYVLVACISLICSVEFFRLAHAGTMSWVLAIGFELGAMCCLLSTLILPKEKQALVWLMFVLLTLFQMMGNTYAAYSALDNFQGWIELFGLEEMEPIAQKRVLACISGAILPLVALGFVRTMVNVLQPGEKKTPSEEGTTEQHNEEQVQEPVETTVEQPTVEQEAQEPTPEPEQPQATELEESEQQVTEEAPAIDVTPAQEPKEEPATINEIKVEPIAKPKRKKNTVKVFDPSINQFVGEYIAKE